MLTRLTELCRAAPKRQKKRSPAGKENSPPAQPESQPATQPQEPSPAPASPPLVACELEVRQPRACAASCMLASFSYWAGSCGPCITRPAGKWQLVIVQHCCVASLSRCSALCCWLQDEQPLQYLGGRQMEALPDSMPAGDLLELLEFLQVCVLCCA